MIQFVQEFSAARVTTGVFYYFTVCPLAIDEFVQNCTVRSLLLVGERRHLIGLLT